MNARVVAIFIGKAWGTRDNIRIAAHAGRVSVWYSRTTTLPRAIELAAGMKAGGVRRVWVESPAAPASFILEIDN